MKLNLRPGLDTKRIILKDKDGILEIYENHCNIIVIGELVGYEENSQIKFINLTNQIIFFINNELITMDLN